LLDLKKGGYAITENWSGSRKGVVEYIRGDGREAKIGPINQPWDYQKLREVR